MTTIQMIIMGTIILYLCMVIFTGVMIGRRSKKSSEGFYLGGRGMGPLVCLLYTSVIYENGEYRACPFWIIALDIFIQERYFRTFPIRCCLDHKLILHQIDAEAMILIGVCLNFAVPGREKIYGAQHDLLRSGVTNDNIFH